MGKDDVSKLRWIKVMRRFVAGAVVMLIVVVVAVIVGLCLNQIMIHTARRAHGYVLESTCAREIKTSIEQERERAEIRDKYK